MISAEHYQDFYLVVVFILTFFVALRYYGFTQAHLVKNRTSWLGAFILCVAVIIYIGIRPVSSIFPDMSGYIDAVENAQFSLDNIRWDNNYVFVPLMVLLSNVGASGTVTMLVLSAIYFGAAFLATRKLFPNDAFLAMLVFLAAFTTFSSATNGMKAGCATTLFLCAVAYRESIITCILFLVLSLGFHHAAQLLIVVFVVCSFINNTRLYLYVWVVCLLLAIFHVTYFQSFFGRITDEQGAAYLLLSADSIDSGYGGKIGFRWDFVLYSVFPIILGCIALLKKRIVSKNYQLIVNIYILSNAIWLLCMYAPYTNRIAALSWGLYSVVIIYPMLRLNWGNNQYKKLVYIVFGSLFFTMFMHFIYY